jgi:hypothetical protein
VCEPVVEKRHLIAARVFRASSRVFDSIHPTANTPEPNVDRNIVFFEHEHEHEHVGCVSRSWKKGTSWRKGFFVRR